MRASCPPPTTATTGAVTGDDTSRAPRARRNASPDASTGGAPGRRAILAGPLCPTIPRSSVSAQRRADRRPGRRRRRPVAPAAPRRRAAGARLRARPVPVGRWRRVRRRPRPVQPAAVRSRARCSSTSRSPPRSSPSSRRRSSRGWATGTGRSPGSAPTRRTRELVVFARHQPRSARSIPRAHLAFSHYMLGLTTRARGQRRHRARASAIGTVAALPRLQAVGLHGRRGRSGPEP